LAFSSGQAHGVKPQINVTPLVDVVLVLLIIFMVVTPLLKRGKDVRLPRAESAGGGRPEPAPLVLSVTRDHQVFLDETPLDGDALGAAIARALSAQAHRKVLLKADESLTVGDVRRVMDHARRAGAGGVALAVREPSSK
jgi:biopolymer transport protein ExbD